LSNGQRLSWRCDLNGVKPVVGSASDQSRTKAEEQESSNTATSEHVSLLALPTSGWRPIMFSPQSPPDQKEQAKRNLPNSSAQINPCGRRFGVYASANGQPFLVSASLFLKSFSYPPGRHALVSSRVYSAGPERYVMYTVTQQLKRPARRSKSQSVPVPLERWVAPFHSTIYRVPHVRDGPIVANVGCLSSPRSVGGTPSPQGVSWRQNTCNQ
jgi:hypothetical protein